MGFKNPFADFEDSAVEESFGDYAHLEQSEPSFLRDDFDPAEFTQRRSSDDSDKTAAGAAMPNMVSLARVFMWDRLPGGYSMYGDKDGFADIESFVGEKRQCHVPKITKVIWQTQQTPHSRSLKVYEYKRM